LKKGEMMAYMIKEQKFYKVLQDIFIGAKVEGQGGFVNLMRIKSNYYSKIEKILKQDVEEALKQYPSFREELFDKLYSFFIRYFSESGSIYFNSTPFHNNVYEKVYTDDKDVILFWKTQMLYYVKTDRIFRSMPVVFDGYKFYFDATTIENKKANEKRSLIYELKEIQKDKTIVFNVYYSEKGRVTKTEDIFKELKKKEIKLDEEQLERAFRIFEKQSEVDFFINKNAKAFLQEQFKLWSYQYFWDGAKEWTADRVNQLQILKDIAFKIIDFVSQFEDELVKIWNKPKFVKNSNYVITLDRLNDNIIEKIIYHSNLDEQIEEWKRIGIVDEEFEIEHIFEDLNNRSKASVLDLYSKEELRKQGLISTGYHLPYNPNLVERAKELRKNMTAAEKKLWYEYLRNFKYRVLRQRPINHFIVDFYCPALKLVIEVDGEHHYTEEGKSYDEERRKILESYGLRELRFRNEEVLKEFERVCKEIEGIPPASPLNKGGIKGGIKKEFSHLPIDTKYFKDLELEILSLFDDLDNSLDGWLIKSENYQALNTILPKFKEKVQTIYIDPPFNLDSSDQFLYRTNYKDANWATLLENRLRIAREWLNEKGSIFVRCDYNGNWIVRCLLDEIFGKENFRNEIAVKRTRTLKGESGRFHTAWESLYFYGKSDNTLFNGFRKLKPENEWEWVEIHLPGTRKDEDLLYRNFFGKRIKAPEGRRWALSQEALDDAISKGLVKMDEQTGMPKFLTKWETLGSNWTDISGYSPTHGFTTENSEELLQRAIESTSNQNNLILDFFLGSGTTTAVAHKLGRKWIGVEMGEHFYTVVLPRMKKVLAYDKSGISKEVKEYQGGGFFKYYELEQYEEALANTVYENHDMLIVGNKSVYEQYVFMKDEKMLRALEIDYKNNKVKVDLSKLYENIDIAETLSNLTGKWIKKITPRQTSSDTPLKEGDNTPLTPLKDGIYEVEFEDGSIVNTSDLDYKLIKPLIWWE
jgi:very-short-patch-repair endonuclease/DNA modification methylase